MPIYRLADGTQKTDVQVNQTAMQFRCAIKRTRVFISFESLANYTYDTIFFIAFH